MILNTIKTYIWQAFAATLFVALCVAGFKLIGALHDRDTARTALAAVQRAQAADLVLRFNAERLRFYAKLTTFATFGRGWVNRVAGNLDHAAADN